MQAEDAREKAAAAAADAAKLAAQAQVLGREAKLGRELRDDNYRLEESLHAYAAPLQCLTSLVRLHISSQMGLALPLPHSYSLNQVRACGLLQAAQQDLG